MNRIRVVGSSGSGKTTTAKAIAARLDIPRLELDAVHWLPNWQERSAEEMRARALEFASAYEAAAKSTASWRTSKPQSSLKKRSWVSSGNWS